MPAYLLKVADAAHLYVDRALIASPSVTLAALHEVLHSSFSLPENRLWGFFTGGRPWEEARHHGGPGTGARYDARETPLAGLGIESGGRFLYLHDYRNERWHYIDVIDRIATDAREPGGFEIWMERGGPASYPLDPSRPDEVPPAALLRAHRDLVRRLRRYLPRLRGFGDQGPPRAYFREGLDLAREVLAFAEGIPGRVRGIGIGCGTGMEEWLWALGKCLDDCGCRTEALGLLEEAAVFFAPQRCLAARAEILMHQDRKRGAAEIEAALERFPDDPLMLGYAAEVWLHGLALRKSSRCHERALRLARERGEPGMETLLEERREDLLDLLEEAGLSAGQGRVRPRIRSPKVGRNDPCPCGSGRKSKRCCH